MAAASMNFRTSLRFGILAEDKTDADTIGVLIRRIATERAGASASAIGIRTRSVEVMHEDERLALVDNDHLLHPDAGLLSQLGAAGCSSRRW